jgi:hypothetical protein
MVDDLGFLNMMEGSIPKLFYSVRVEDIERLWLRKHDGHWCNGLILQLLQIGLFGMGQYILRDLTASQLLSSGLWLISVRLCYGLILPLFSQRIDTFWT